MEKKGMENKQKAKILATVTILFAIGMYFTKSFHARIFMGVVLLAHYYFFLVRVKTLKSNDTDLENKDINTATDRKI